MRCSKCGCAVKLRDHKKRIIKENGGGVKWLYVERVQCTNESCRKISNVLPDILIPYKQYSSELIEDVIDKVIDEENNGDYDYPSDSSMKNWRRWIARNVQLIEGTLRSVPYRLLGLSSEFLFSKDSLLEELKRRISPGWLWVATRIVYNSGGAYEVLAPP